MIGMYFSGTGNSKYALEVFMREYSSSSKIYSIEDEIAIEEIRRNDEIVFSYPVQYSTVPKILRDYIVDHKELWNNKKIYIIATMGLFSGDGSGVLERLFKRFGAKAIGGLHLKMPDSIADEKVLKRNLQKNIKIVKKAETKILAAVRSLKSGNPKKEGLGIFSRFLGLFGQRLYFGYKTRNYSSQLKIDQNKCISCKMCTELCPMKNLKIVDNKIQSNDKCTLCYRCINRCPKQAITLLGKKVIEQATISKYI